MEDSIINVQLSELFNNPLPVVVFVGDDTDYWKLLSESEKERIRRELKNYKP